MHLRQVLILVVALYPLLSFAQGTPSPSPFGLQDRTSGLGLSRDYNPAIGANLLIGAEYLSRDDAIAWPSSVREGLGRTGLFFQEAEISFAAAVDPYIRADLTAAFHAHDSEFRVHLEEGYVTTLFIPRVTLRAGKFYLPFGRHNVLHTHAFPFVDAPLTNQTFFGHEGLNEVAAEASVLLPLPWFFELTAYVADGKNEALFASKQARDLAFGGRLQNMLELSESTTLLLGGSYASGKNSARKWTYIFGADMTLRWIPPGRERYHQLIWQAEYLQVRGTGHHEDELANEPAEEAEHDHEHASVTLQSELPSGLGGFSTFVAVKVAQQWWLEGRFEGLGYPKGEKRLHRTSGLIAFVPSEYSALRLQYSYFHEPNIHQVLFQINVTFGAHPAHPY